MDAIYLPARFRTSRRYPLLVVHDGGDYLNYAGMKAVLDNLIHRLEIPDMVVVVQRLARPAARVRQRRAARRVHHRGAGARGGPARSAARAAAGARPDGGELRRHRRVLDRGEVPGVLGRLLLQSGSFAFTDIGRHNRRGPLFDRIVEFVNQYRSAPVAVTERIFMSCGVYESLIYENRSMVPLLTSTGMQLRFVEARDGHNWENWRDRLREGLSWLFPGPLMFIYE